MNSRHGNEEQRPNGSEVILEKNLISANEEAAIKKSLKDLLFYIVFLIIISMIAFGMVGTHMYYFKFMVQSIIAEREFTTLNNDTITLLELRTFDDFWQFSQTALIDAIYWEDWNKYSTPPTLHTSRDDRNVLVENKLLGVPVLRQVRVRNDSCKIHPDFQSIFDECYGYFSDQAEDRQAFQVTSNISKSAWVFTDGKNLGSLSYTGDISYYGKGGYRLNLSPQKNETLAMIYDLKKNNWIGRGTRAVFIDFTLYNANINLFCLVKIVLEFPPTGGILPSWSIHPLKLIRYSSVWDYFILVCEIMYVLFLVYFIIEAALGVKKLRLKYIYHFWHWIDIMIILVKIKFHFLLVKDRYGIVTLSVTMLVYKYIPISITYIICSLLTYFTVKALIYDLIIEENDNPHFEYAGFLQTILNNTVALLVFFSWVRLFKFLAFNKTLTQLNTTLSRCAKDIFGFSIMFIIIFFAFAQLGYLLFGTQLLDYCSVGKSSMALLQTILGEFNYQQIEEANRFLAPIFFITFVFFVFFVLLNMFLAIINDAFSEVKSEVKLNESNPVLKKYLKSVCKTALNRFCCGLGKKCCTETEEPMNETYQRIRQELKRANFNDFEIEMFLAKYDIKPNKSLTDRDRLKMIEDLNLQRYDLSTEINISNEQEADVSRLNEKFEQLQSKVNLLVDQLAAITEMK